MGRVLFLVGLVLVEACSVWGASEPHVTPADQCPGQNFENLRELVHINHCGKTRCKLVRGTNATVTIRFTPTEEIKNLVTNVNANLAGVDLPFIGVTGTSACSHIKKADSGEAAPCPLQPDVEYLYTNTFPVQAFYPQTSLRVHWAITAGNKDLVCFEIPAVIK